MGPRRHAPSGRSPGHGRPSLAARAVKRPWLVLRLVRRSPRARRRLAMVGALFALLVLAVSLWALWPYWQLSGQFDDVPTIQPSRLYGQPALLEAGKLIDLDAVVGALRAEGYRPLEEGERLSAGRFQRASGALTVAQRSFPTPTGPGGGGALTVRVKGRRITGLELAGREVEAAYLDPPLIATYYGPDVKERRPVRVDELPEALVGAILAAEDSGFFRHMGLSPSGIARAAWVNVSGGEVRQGGSTLTQQLVKNLYLTHERTLSRKVREAFLALFLEVRYSKREILQAYLNEIYLGSSNGVNLIGVGAASRAFFGKDPQQLDLGEAALLAGMIRAPANYSPIAHPDAAKARRDQVLARMVETGAIAAETAERAASQPVRTAPSPVVRRRAPYFAEHAAEEAARRFGVERVADGGYTLFSTLDWRAQQAAQEAVDWGLPALESGWEKGHQVAGPLQAALVSIDPRDGGIRAYVGGRDFAASQFDRVSQARRQAGSAFKPVVYATAFETGSATPATLIEDAPLTVRLPTQTWRPVNYDSDFHGWVRVRTALEESYNVATARLALQTGLDEIIATARRLGITTPLEPVPSLALGAFEVTPLEMAEVYATLAQGGVRPPVHALTAVIDRGGWMVQGLALPAPERVLSAQSTYLLTSLLQGVLDRGTGASSRTQGLRDAMAGKTGTSNDRRDNWFAGYAPELAAVVWVGYDDNAPTRMSGARAALPIWTRYAVAVRPPGGYSNFRMPPGVTTAVIDPESGELATDDCPRVVTEVFLDGQVPTDVCRLHQGYWWVDQGPDLAQDDEEWQADDETPQRRRGRVRRWLRRVFGDGDDDQGEPPGAETAEPPPPRRR